MHSDDILVLPQGTPIIMVEMSIDCEEGISTLLPELPKVYAGRLIEPHPLTEGLTPSLLVAGPLARCLTPKDFDSRVILWSDKTETLMIFIAPEVEGHFRAYWVTKDLWGVVEEAEVTAMRSWEDAENARRNLYRRAVETFAHTLGDSLAGLVCG